MRKGLITAALNGLLVTQTAAAQEADVKVFFLADPQVHNVHGIALKQMFPLADKASKVAIRPPEVNLLAPLVLRHALEMGRKAVGPDNNVVVVLGDGTNIGCSGEADVFDGEFDRLSGTVRLMAHGNHDSYMMGTINSYGPVDSNRRVPTLMMRMNLPVDETWWTPKLKPESQKPSLFGRNWLDACYKPPIGKAEAGTPMNKVRWLARYAQSLERHGLLQRFEGRTTDEGFEYVETAAPSTALAKLNYRSRGVWYRPQTHDAAPPDYYQRTWKSFLVQAADLSEYHTLVLIDTSVCLNARGGVHMWGTNAGTNGCIGERQFEIIRKLLKDIPASRQLIFAGHFPLKALESEERDMLRTLMRERSPAGWTFVSGHTHDASSPYVEADGVDLNIGSTTDWPMESHVIRFAAGSQQIVSLDSKVLGTTYLPLAYSVGWDWAGKYSELCRHLPAAAELAAAKPCDYEVAWTSPTVTKDECVTLQDKWSENADKLTGYQARISWRFDHEADYRRFILRLAAGASLYEFRHPRSGQRKIR